MSAVLLRTPGAPLEFHVGDVVDAVNDDSSAFGADAFTAPNSSDPAVLCRLPPSGDRHRSRFVALRSGTAQLSSVYIQTCGPCSGFGLTVTVDIIATDPATPR